MPELKWFRMYTKDVCSRNFIYHCMYQGATSKDALQTAIDKGSLSLKRGTIYAVNDEDNICIMHKFELETDTRIV